MDGGAAANEASSRRRTARPQRSTLDAPQHSSSRVGSSVRFFTGSASDTRSHADRASSHHHNSSSAVGAASPTLPAPSPAVPPAPAATPTTPAHSTTTPPPPTSPIPTAVALPGGFHVGDRLVYIGENMTIVQPCRRRNVIVKQGMLCNVTGMANENMKQIGVSLHFPSLGAATFSVNSKFLRYPRVCVEVDECIFDPIPEAGYVRDALRSLG